MLEQRTADCGAADEVPFRFLVGFTELDRRLMAVTSAFESGIHVGSLVIGAPVSGNLFYNFNGDQPIPSSTTDQFQALSGAVGRPEIGLGDAHYIQGVGPVTLRRGKKVDIWVGIIAGENRDQFLANALAAAADVAKRQQGNEAAVRPWTHARPCSLSRSASPCDRSRSTGSRGSRRTSVLSQRRTGRRQSHVVFSGCEPYLIGNCLTG